MLEVARARSEEVAACVAMIPHMANPATIWLTARDGDRFVGAAGIGWTMIGDPAGFPVWAEVMPDARRRRYGTALLAAAAELAGEEADGLWTAQMFGADPAIDGFLAANGFAPAQRTLYFRVPLAPFVEELARVVTLLRRRGRIPSSARIVPAGQVDRTELSHMIGNALSTGPSRIQGLLAQAALEGEGDLAGSQALLDGDRLAGALLCRLADPDRVVILSNVVAPAWRRGWANALLLEATSRGMLARGASLFDFDCDESVRDSINLATRGGGLLTGTRTRTRWYQAFAS